jgi:thiol-disulfide isomerase/thioredoxin
MNLRLAGALLFLICQPVQAQATLEYASFNQLETEILKDQNHVVVLNFWATWCKPCVAELPDFEKIHAELGKKGVRVILANLDLHSKVEPAVPQFIQKQQIQSRVVHITDQDANDYINRVDPTWSGSIPATLIYFQGKKVWFFEGQTDYETIKSILIKYIQL